MLNFPPVRKQGDQKQDLYSEAGSLTFDPKDDLTRQEFKNDTDINHLMDRFGVSQRQGNYGEIDYDLDLQQASAAASEARDVHNALSAPLRQVYPTWQSMLAAMADGSFEQTVEDLKTAAAEAINERKELEELRKERLNAFKESQGIPTGSEGTPK